MTDRIQQPNGTCPDWQPGDRIIMPGAAGFEAQCNRMIARFGWAKNKTIIHGSGKPAGAKTIMG